MKWHKALFVLTMLAAAPAMAQKGAPEKTVPPTKKTDAGYVYAPEGCEFTMTFPTEPYNGRLCAPDNPKNCMPQTTYTKVYGLDATVNFNVTCNPVSADIFGRYNQDVMQITLAAMANKNRLDSYETGFQQVGDHAKQAVILGTGRTGDSEKLFMAQIWVGRHSLMTVEGEVVGPSHEEAEGLMADILSSIRPAGEASPSPSVDEKPAKDGRAEDKNTDKDDAEKDSE